MAGMYRAPPTFRTSRLQAQKYAAPGDFPPAETPSERTGMMPCCRSADQVYRDEAAARPPDAPKLDCASPFGACVVPGPGTPTVE